MQSLGEAPSGADSARAASAMAALPGPSTGRAGPSPPSASPIVSLPVSVARMGPTAFLPRSHTRGYHELRERDQTADADEDTGYCAPLLRQGSAVLMDAACFHGGGAWTLLGCKLGVG